MRPTPKERRPSYEISACTGLSLSNCNAKRSCYWSILFDRCEELKFGAGFKPIEVENARKLCETLNEQQCRVRADCFWGAGVCTKETYRLSSPP